MKNEDKRQIVHIVLLALAFLLKYLSHWQAAGLLLFLVVLTIYLVPRLKIKSYFYRRHEQKYSQGAILYFLILLILVFIFPLYIVAASWAVLALGDGAATLIGKNFKVKELPWNRGKSYIGSLSFVVFGTLGAYLLLRWMAPPINPDIFLSASFKTAVVAAVVESLPIKLNDNVSVALTSAVVLTFLI